MEKVVVGIFFGMLMIGSVFASANIIGLDKEKNNFNELTVTIPIGNYEIKKTGYRDNIYLEDFGILNIPGKPNLPSKIFSIAIPPGTTMKDISFDKGKGIILDGIYNINQVNLPRVIGLENPKIYEQELARYNKNYKSVYNSNDVYPSSIVQFEKTAGFRKYNLVDIKVNPFTYKPLSKQLTFYPDITVTVSYTYPKTFSPQEIMIDNNEKTEKVAEQLILNYNQAKNWYPTGKGSRDNYDYVIITLESLESSITELVSWEEAKGKNVYVATTTWINNNYDGYDLAEKMRNFLRDKYPEESWGILDVCLIGHWDDVPIRLTAQNTGYGRPETDFYYAELSLPDSNSWDSDGDHQYGEDSDPVDMYAEVNVGRIPWSDPDTVEHICEKSVAYEENNDPSFKENILLLGAFFWPDTDNAVLMEYKTDPDEHPWMEDWTMVKMYEDAQSPYECDYDLSYNNVETVWSQGSFAFVDWAGHGSPTACFEYYPSQAFVDTNLCQYLNDDYPAIIFADACSNSDTSETNIGMKMLEQGAVGFLGATKVAYGYHGWDDPYDGAASSMDYFFTTCVTSTNYTQGQAQQWALAEMYTYGLWYYPKFETFEWGALWGNPNLGMKYHPASVDINITSVNNGWNFVSLPFQIPDLTPTISLDLLTIKTNNGLNSYSWSDAITAGIIDPSVFGWDRNNQIYIFSSSIEPGYGYWLYAYEECEIWIENITLSTKNEITNLQQNWNIIGSAFDQSINLENVIVNYNNIDYTWSEATDPVNGPIVDPSVFGWDRNNQIYIFSTELLPGHAYWIYSYEPCTLILPAGT